MKGEEIMEEHDHKAQTCDMWGHVIREPLPTKADDRPKATPSALVSVHICRRSFLPRIVDIANPSKTEIKDYDPPCCGSVKVGQCRGLPQPLERRLSRGL